MEEKEESGEKAGKLPVLGRRVFLGSLVSGFFLSRVFAFQSPSQSERLLRPPGVVNDNDFQKKCVRCGECMKVCLQKCPVSRLFQGRAVRPLHAGPCAPSRILRIQLQPLRPGLPHGGHTEPAPGEKEEEIIGVAVIDQNHCLPYAKRMNCIVCEEHCPIPEKAIRSEVVEETDYNGKKMALKKPYIVDELCNGCGICENKCPVEGKSAIEVFSKKKG